ncbi:MAG: sulfurtransferase TusA family protein [Synechococcus sp.]
MTVAETGPARRLDLRGTPCPVNFIRCKLALETMMAGQELEVILDRGEPEAMVVPGLQHDGHRVELDDGDQHWVALRVICGGG